MCAKSLISISIYLYIYIYTRHSDCSFTFQFHPSIHPPFLHSSSLSICLSACSFVYLFFSLSLSLSPFLLVSSKQSDRFIYVELLKHQCPQIIMEYCILDILEHMLDVFCVDGCSKVMEQWLATLPAPRVKQVAQEAFDIIKTAGVTFELWKVLANVYSSHLLLQQIHLVEEEDDRDGCKASVIDNGLKDVTGFHQAVGLAVLHQNLTRAKSYVSAQYSIHGPQ